jgi:NAD+ kinase
MTGQKALLIVNPHKTHAQEIAGEIREELSRRGLECHAVSYDNGWQPALAHNDFDIAFSLGGDGTVLYAARLTAEAEIPIFPLNIGTLGFIAAVPPDRWQEVFDEWQQGHADISLRIMLSASVLRGENCIFELPCLNDVVISSSGIAKIIRLHVQVSSAAIPLGHFRSDGLIAATPTGSTAYSAAAGGPILDPEMEAIIVNPICPFSLSYRPVVLPGDEMIIVDVEMEQRSQVLLTIDGQVTQNLLPGDRIIIKKANFKAQIIASGRSIFYQALRNKLAWSGGRIQSGGAGDA